MLQNRKLDGFSLLEFLLVASISLVVIAGTLEIYLSLQKTYSTQTNLARLQENGRLAALLLRKNIRMAGYVGCNSRGFSGGIQGFAVGDLPGYLRKKVAAGTNAVVIQEAAGESTVLTANINDPANFIRVKKNLVTKSRRQLLISDCEHASIVTAKTFSGKKISLKNILRVSYHKKDAVVAPFIKTAYFVAKTTRKDTHGKWVYALYRSINEGNKEELISGINNMQISYGVDANGDGKVDAYYSAEQVADWEKVLSVLLILSLQEGGDKAIEWPLYIALRERLS